MNDYIRALREDLATKDAEIERLKAELEELEDCVNKDKNLEEIKTLRDVIYLTDREYEKLERENEKLKDAINGDGGIMEWGKMQKELWDTKQELAEIKARAEEIKKNYGIMEAVKHYSGIGIKNVDYIISGKI